MVQVFLNIAQDGAIECYRVLKELGFIFTGIIPGSSNGEYAVMQHLMGLKIEREKIVVTENYGKLLDQVLAL